jgi:hypothetical protein
MIFTFLFATIEIKACFNNNDFETNDSDVNVLYGNPYEI